MNVGQWQFFCNGRRLQLWKTSAFGKVVEQKALPMKVIGTGNGACVLQQGEGRCLAGAAGFYNCFVLRRVFVWPEQNFVKLLFDGAGALAGHELM